MRRRVKNILTLIPALLVVAAIAGLSVRFAGQTLHWRETLKQARVALLIWRLCLYSLMAGLWLSLRQRWLKQAPARLPALNRMVVWSLVLLLLGEISNGLQEGDTP